MNSCNPNTTNKFAIEIAGVSVLAKASGDHFVLEIGPAHERFLKETHNSDIELTVYYEEPPAISDRDKLMFDTGVTWRLYESQNNYTITIDNQAVGPGVQRLARFDKNFEKGELFFRPNNLTEGRKSPDGKPMLDPFTYPLDELLIVNKVADGRGVDIHGCAVSIEQNGFLFIGVSGAGKSTLANLWKIKSIDILSDDRLVVKPVNDKFWVYGTPWHGDAKVSLAMGAPLKNMYFIKQDEKNYLNKLPTVEVMTRLLVMCFPTFYLKEKMETTVALLESIAETVPAYEFGFVDDRSAVDFILSEVNK